MFAPLEKKKCLVLKLSDNVDFERFLGIYILPFCKIRLTDETDKTDTDKIDRELRNDYLSV